MRRLWLVGQGYDSLSFSQRADLQVLWASLGSLRTVVRAQAAGWLPPWEGVTDPAMRDLLGGEPGRVLVRLVLLWRWRWAGWPAYFNALPLTQSATPLPGRPPPWPAGVLCDGPSLTKLAEQRCVRAGLLFLPDVAGEAAAADVFR